MVTHIKQTSMLKQPQTQIHHTTFEVNYTYNKEFIQWKYASIYSITYIYTYELNSLNEKSFEIKDIEVEDMGF